MKDNSKFIKLAILLAFALVLSYFESLIPLPIPVPGIRLGLANSVGLIILFLFNKKDYIVFNVLKVLLMAILRNGFGMAFFISLSGTFLSTVFTLLFLKISKASIYGISVIGASFHGLGQMLMISILYSNIFFINYLPVVMVFSIISGLLTAFIASLVLRRLPNKILNS